MRKKGQTAVDILVDILLLAAAVGLSAGIRFEGSMEAWQMQSTLKGLPMLLAVYALCFAVGGMYRVLWQYAGAAEIGRMIAVCALGGAVTVALNDLGRFYMSRSLLVLTAVFLCVETGLYRLLRYYLPLRALRTPRSGTLKRVVILGAGNAGAYVVHLCRMNAERFGVPVAFLDDDPGKKGMRLHGIPVLGRVDELPDIVREKNIDSIVIAMPSLREKPLSRVADLAASTKKPVFVFSAPLSVQGNGHIRRIGLEDLLEGPEAEPDTQAVEELVKGKNILLIGAGCVSGELAAVLANAGCVAAAVLDAGAEALGRMQLPQNTQRIVGSAQDAGRLQEVCGQFRPDLIIHTDRAEGAPEGERRKILCGASRNITATGVRSVLLGDLAGDDALREACGIITSAGGSAVCFGTVFDTRCGTAAQWDAQLQSEGPLQVAAAQSTQSMISARDAARRILLAATLPAGRVYYLDMGKPCRMMELAERFMRLYGYDPGVNMQIQITDTPWQEEILPNGLEPTQRSGILCARTGEVRK